MPPIAIDLTGQRFDRWIVITRHLVSGEPRWHCLCDCGTKAIVFGKTLRNGTSRSCGCLRNERVRESNAKRITHGKSGTPEYVVWCNMISRCSNPNSTYFSHYGARGIKVCKRWRKFENFLADMGPRPTAQHELDRRNNELGYKPANCQWITRKAQMRNTRQNHWLQLRGEALTIIQWAERLGIKYRTLRSRLDAGWPIERALSPVKYRTNGKPLATR